MPPVVAGPPTGSARPLAPPQAPALPGGGGGGKGKSAGRHAGRTRWKGEPQCHGGCAPCCTANPPLPRGDPRHCPGRTPSSEGTQGHRLGPGRPRGLWAYRHSPAGSGVRSLVPPQGWAAGAGTAAVATAVGTGCVRQEDGVWGSAIQPPRVTATVTDCHPGQSTACRRARKRRTKNIKECLRPPHRRQLRPAPHWPWPGLPCGPVRPGRPQAAAAPRQVLSGASSGPWAPLAGSVLGGRRGWSAPRSGRGGGRRAHPAAPPAKPQAPPPAPGRRPGGQGCCAPAACSGGRGWAPPAQTPLGRSAGVARTRPPPGPVARGSPGHTRTWSAPGPGHPEGW